jgi:hypothetical protein
MAKKVLIIDPSRERLELYLQVRPHLAPDFEIVAAENMNEAMAAIEASPPDKIVLSAVIHNSDHDVNGKRFKALVSACPTAECFVYNTRDITDIDHLTAFFRVFSYDTKRVLEIHKIVDFLRKG